MMKKPARSSAKSAQRKVAAKKKPSKPAPKKVAPKKAAPKKKAPKKKAPKKAALKKPAPKKTASKKAAPKKAKTPAPKPKKVAAKAAKSPAKPSKKSTVAKKAVKPAKPAPAKKPPEAAKKGKLAGEATPGKRGRKGAKITPGAAGEIDEPNAEALAAAEAEVTQHVPKKPKPRRRRSRQMPRVPVELRNKPAWAEAWTALAETGSDIDTIKRILQYASRLFIGLGELTPKNTEELLRFFEVNDAPAGIESILEEAFLAQPQQADRKSALEAFFKEALKTSSISEALKVLYLAGHQGDWREAAKRLRALHSPHSENAELYLLAREAVG